MSRFKCANIGALAPISGAEGLTCWEVREVTPGNVETVSTEMQSVATWAQLLEAWLALTSV